MENVRGLVDRTLIESDYMLQKNVERLREAAQRAEVQAGKFRSVEGLEPAIEAVLRCESVLMEYRTQRVALNVPPRPQMADEEIIATIEADNQQQRLRHLLLRAGFSHSDAECVIILTRQTAWGA